MINDTNFLGLDWIVFLMDLLLLFVLTIILGPFNMVLHSKKMTPTFFRFTLLYSLYVFLLFYIHKYLYIFSHLRVHSKCCFCIVFYPPIMSEGYSFGIVHPLSVHQEPYLLMDQI